MLEDLVLVVTELAKVVIVLGVACIAVAVIVDIAVVLIGKKASKDVYTAIREDVGLGLSRKNITIEIATDKGLMGSLITHTMMRGNKRVPIYRVIYINPWTLLRRCTTMGLRYRDLGEMVVVVIEHELGHIIAHTDYDAGVSTVPLVSMVNEIDAWDRGVGCSGVQYQQEVYEKVREFSLNSYTKAGY